jgi:hypothetical protein
MSKEVCSGSSPWHGTEKGIRNILQLRKWGIDVSKLTEKEARDILSTIIDNEINGNYNNKPDESDYPLGENIMRIG